jgi:hypothetical protein
MREKGWKWQEAGNWIKEKGRGQHGRREKIRVEGSEVERSDEKEEMGRKRWEGETR